MWFIDRSWPDWRRSQLRGYYVGATLDDRRDDDWRVNITFGDIEASFRRRRVFFPEFGLHSFMDCAAIRSSSPSVFATMEHATIEYGHHSLHYGICDYGSKAHHSLTFLGFSDDLWEDFSSDRALRSGIIL